MRIQNPGRVAGLWYLMLVFLGPVRLMYIPGKLFDYDDPAGTTRNIAEHEWLFRFGVLSELAAAVVLIFLVMAFYRLFRHVSQHHAMLVILFGGVMPALINFVNVVTDAGVLLIARGAPFLAAFNKPQQDGLLLLLLKLHSAQYNAAEILWGMWLFPLATLVYRSGFLPRFLGVWLMINGIAYVSISLTAFLFPQYVSKVFLYAQPALFGELALVLWLLIKGATPSESRREA